MTNTLFRGIATAMATPMKDDGSIDYAALGRFLDFQLEHSVAALVAVGTTGEGATLRAEEQLEVLRFTVRAVAGRVPVIAGTGSNCTATAVERTRAACGEGADGVLVVTPYYNKATQDGLLAHYTAVADASEKPVILYNVPSRTGCNLLPQTAATLAGHPKIRAVKEASGNLSQVVELRALCGDTLDIYSGEDALTVPILSMGGAGCISVVSNVVPGLAVEMCDRFFAGDTAAAAQLQCRLLPLIQALFSRVNPIPVKAALAAMGFGANALRLPLTPMELPEQETLLHALRALGVAV